jgi:hypothetical protein
VNAALVLLAAAACGVDYGYQPLPDGGFEYIIQLEPELLDALRDGEAVTSDIRLDLRGARSYRIVVGTEPPPREAPPRLSPAQVDAADADADDEMPAAEDGDEEAESEPDEAAHEGHNHTAHRPGLEGRGGLSPPQGDAEGDAAPGPFDADENSGPLVQQADYQQQAGGEEQDAEGSPSDSTADDREPPKPWVPFSLAMLGLFASVGGNCYLGWLALGLRNRYIAALTALRERRIEVDAD